MDTKTRAVTRVIKLLPCDLKKRNKQGAKMGKEVTRLGWAIEAGHLYR